MNLRSLLILLLGLSLTACGKEEKDAIEAAQKEAGVAEEAADAAAAEDEGEGEDEDAPPPPHSVKPQKALKAVHAAYYRLIDIVDTGERLIAVGQRGNIVTSEDGKTWKQVNSPVNVMLTRARFLDSQHGWIVGFDGAILHTSDGGRTWQVQRYDAEGRQLYDILMLDAQNGIAVGGYGTYLTTSDGGASWTQQSFALTELGLHFNSLIKLGDGSLFMVGEKSLMAYSKDNGATWQMLNSPYNGTFFGALPLGERGALIHGMRGQVYLTRDVTAADKQDPATFDPGTRTASLDPEKMGWQRIGGGLKESMFGATALPDGEFLLVGINGLCQKTRLASRELDPFTTPAEATLSDVLVYKNRLIAAGKRGVVELGTL